MDYVASHLPQRLGDLPTALTPIYPRWQGCRSPRCATVQEGLARADLSDTFAPATWMH